MLIMIMLVFIFLSFLPIFFQAKLNKNYGMTRMDPFCSVRINHTVYETETCSNGAKNPTWGRPIAVMISEPVETVYIEVFDEVSFIFMGFHYLFSLKTYIETFYKLVILYKFIITTYKISTVAC